MLKYFHIFYMISLHVFIVINENFNFSCKKNRGEKLKMREILSSKSTQEIDKNTPLKSLFDLPRYLYRFPRYTDSKFVQRLTQRRDYEWARNVLTYTFFLEMRTTFFQESRLSLVWSLGQVGETRCKREVRVRVKDRDSKRLKITFFFTRRYLGNRK